MENAGCFWHQILTKFCLKMYSKLIVAIIHHRMSICRFWVHPLLTEKEGKGQFWTLHENLRKHLEKSLSYTSISSVCGERAVKNVYKHFGVHLYSYFNVIKRSGQCGEMCVAVRCSTLLGTSYIAFYVTTRLQNVCIGEKCKIKCIARMSPKM